MHTIVSCDLSNYQSNRLSVSDHEFKKMTFSTFLQLSELCLTYISKSSRVRILKTNIKSYTHFSCVSIVQVNVKIDQILNL